jgi:hypothetical protein
MSVTITGIGFAHHDYDDPGDVLYLSVDGYDTGGLPPLTRRPRVMAWSGPSMAA